ncbi:sensor histidine kinase [Anaerotalea alkaliphila]|uniref:Sensor histidine kinase n=1 Tax=Anaerotalea alkaliphila TaxID=2662126 RepID=A0A7X5KLD2_9FIRM|nr:sensor histidine kinase [Anaerotalea alkaliphila]NDL66574.1 sensor histidine kinase [Anaerotalea alkaliphila]
MRKQRTSSVRKKLIGIGFLLIAVPIISIIVTYSITVKEIIKNKYTQTAIQSVYETSEKLDYLLSDLQKFSTAITSNSELLQLLENRKEASYEDFNQVLRGFITSRSDVELIELVAHGVRYSAGVNRIDKGLLMDATLKNSKGQPLWFPTRSEEIQILSGRFEKNYFTLARKIIDFNTLKDQGYLVLYFEEALLKQAYAGLVDDEGAEVLICDGEGQILSASNEKRIGGSILEEPYFRQALLDPAGQDFVEYQGNVDQVVIHSTISSNGWKLIKTISTDYLYAEMNRIQAAFVWGGLFYVLVIIGFMLFFSFKYTEPLIRMQGVMKQVEKGDLTARTEVKSDDEIGELGKSLNQMIAEMQNLIHRLVREEQEKKEVELEALHAQINPHFLYNTLNTIKWMAKIQGNLSVSKAITALVKLLRISINLGRDMISLGEEVDYVRNYIVIQELRFNEGIHVVYDLEERTQDIMVPKLILQPIVENSILYGITEEHPELHIHVRSFLQESELVVEIQDDGPGIEEATLNQLLTSKTSKDKFSRVGLNNVDQRIRLHCGQQYGLEIDTEPGKGTRVVVRLSAGMVGMKAE